MNKSIHASETIAINNIKRKQHCDISTLPKNILNCKTKMNFFMINCEQNECKYLHGGSDFHKTVYFILMKINLRLYWYYNFGKRLKL